MVQADERKFDVLLKFNSDDKNFEPKKKKKKKKVFKRTDKHIRSHIYKY